MVAPEDVFDRSPLHVAAENGHVTCVEQLCVSDPGHVNDRDERGLTPLHLAARERHRYASIMAWKCSLLPFKCLQSGTKTFPSGWVNFEVCLAGTHLGRWLQATVIKNCKTEAKEISGGLRQFI